jgi:sugar phosphate isomerase/epimerase
MDRYDVLASVPPEKAISLIGEAGFQHTEFGITHETRYLENNPDEKSCLKAILHSAEQAGVSISQIHGFMFNPCGADLA